MMEVCCGLPDRWTAWSEPHGISFRLCWSYLWSVSHWRCSLQTGRRSVWWNRWCIWIWSILWTMWSILKWYRFWKPSTGRIKKKKRSRIWERNFRQMFPMSWRHRWHRFPVTQRSWWTGWYVQRTSLDFQKGSIRKHVGWSHWWKISLNYRNWMKNQ